MKKLMLSIFALAAVVFSANAVGVTASATGHVDLVVPGTVAIGTNNLEFGQIEIGTAGGTITMAPTVVGEFTPVAVGNVALFGTTVRTVADFDVTGGTTQVCGIGLPEDLILSGGNGDVTIAFNSSAATLTLSEGVGTFYVGGTLTIPAGAAADDYTGTFEVTVSYN